MHQFLKFILVWNDTLYVSDGLSVHCQEYKTVHTATGICQTVSWFSTAKTKAIPVFIYFSCNQFS